MTVQTKPEVHWIEWSPQAFERAQREDKLILLDSGATWCHWCHVMDHMTYEDEDVARLLNERFVPIRIDRDRLSDVDHHFQRCPAIIESQAGGWPLTVILTPDGDVLYKATFLPPRGMQEFGPGFGLIELLRRLDTYWRTNRDHLRQVGREMKDALTRHETQLFGTAGQPSAEIIEEIVAALRQGFDPDHGGFADAPKFFSAPALELLLSRAWHGGAEALDMAAVTLDAIARGGVHDHVGGGFHRYSVDARWHVPHFEKMGYDNAALLALYSNAWALTGREEFATIARRTAGWIDSTLGDPDGQGFYSSQDADIGPEDDGDYFTWTVEEVRQALGERADTILYYYDIDTRGDMRDRPGRNVLHVVKSPAQAARLLNKEPGQLERDVVEARDMLLEARGLRPTPFIDKTIFADINGMMIDAYLTAYERLGDEHLRDHGLKVLDSLESLRDGGPFAHFSDAGRPGKVGLLVDQAWMMRALIHAFAVSGQTRYLDAAAAVGNWVLDHLVASDGGLLSWPGDDDPLTPPPSRSWDDSPSRSPASVAAQGLIELGYLTGDERFTQAAARAIASFAGSFRPEWGVVMGGYGLAMDSLLAGPRVVVVLTGADDADGRALHAAAQRSYIPAGLALRLDPALPSHRQLIQRLGYGFDSRAVAYVCAGKTCLRPARTVAELRERIMELAAM